MDSDKLFHAADKSMDPAGILALFVYYWASKLTGFTLTQDELLMGSVAFGACRVLWERYKRRRARQEQLSLSRSARV